MREGLVGATEVCLEPPGTSTTGGQKGSCWTDFYVTLRVWARKLAFGPRNCASNVGPAWRGQRPCNRGVVAEPNSVFGPRHGHGSFKLRFAPPALRILDHVLQTSSAI